MKFIAVFLISFFAFTFAVKGVDYSTRLTSAISCLVKEGYTFAIPRGYLSYGAIDPNAVANIKSAWDGGMKNVDVYMFPCFTCGNPKHQVDQLVDGLGSAKYGTIWVDVENHKWSTDHAANRKFILECVEQVHARGKTPGIYSSYYNWESIVGVSWDGVKNLPLWYCHYDNDPSFRDFKPFGGWSKPAIKQYSGDKTVCGAGVDLNFY